MHSTPLVPSFYYYKFAEAISSPYTALSAYTAGAIDAQGNIIKPESSISPFEYFIIKLKKIFEQLPPGMTKSSLSSYIPALQLFSEEAKKFGLTDQEYHFFVEGMVTCASNGSLSYIELIEDMGSANLGGPAAVSNTGSVAGYDPPMQSGIARRKSVLGFEDSCEGFDVCPEHFSQFKVARSWKDVPEEIQNYMYRRSKRTGKRFFVRDSDSGEMHWPMFEDYNPFKEYIEEKVKDISLSSSTADVLNDIARQIDVREPTAVEPKVSEPPKEGKRLSRKKRGGPTEQIGKLLTVAHDAALARAEGGQNLEQSYAGLINPIKGVFQKGPDVRIVDWGNPNVFGTGDIKGHNVTPYKTLNKQKPDEYALVPGFSEMIKKIKDMNLSPEDQKKFIDAELERINTSQREVIGGLASKKWETSDPNLIFPSVGTETSKPFHFGEPGVRVSPSVMSRFAGENARIQRVTRKKRGRSANPRGVEHAFKLRGADISTEEAQERLRRIAVQQGSAIQVPPFSAVLGTVLKKHIHPSILQRIAPMLHSTPGYESVLGRS